MVSLEINLYDSTYSACVMIRKVTARSPIAAIGRVSCIFNIKVPAASPTVRLPKRLDE